LGGKGGTRRVKKPAPVVKKQKDASCVGDKRVSRRGSFQLFGQKITSDPNGGDPGVTSASVQETKAVGDEPPRQHTSISVSERKMDGKG